MSDALGSYQPFWAAESLLTFWIYVQRQEHPNQILPMWCPHSLLGPSSLQLWTFISLLFLLAESKIKEVGKLRQAGCPHLIIKFLLYVRWGFPGSTSGKKKKKNLPTNAGDKRDADSISGSGSSPGEGHGKPLQYSCLENPMDRGTWRATVHRVPQSWTGLKQLSTHTFIRWLVTILRSPSTQRHFKHENL